MWVGRHCPKVCSWIAFGKEVRWSGLLTSSMAFGLSASNLPTNQQNKARMPPRNNKENISEILDTTTSYSSNISNMSDQMEEDPPRTNRRRPNILVTGWEIQDEVCRVREFCRWQLDSFSTSSQIARNRKNLDGRLHCGKIHTKLHDVLIDSWNFWLFN